MNITKDAIRIENMIRLKEQGYSYAVIGALYGLSRQRIHQLISGYHRNNKGLKHKNGWYRQIRNSIIKRDDSQCQKCGATKNLIVHHLDGDDGNNVLSNLITLCNNCHLDLHRPKGWDVHRQNNHINSKINFIKRLSVEPGLKEGCEGILKSIKKKLQGDATKNPLRQPSEFQGKGLKRFCVGLLARIRK